MVLEFKQAGIYCPAADVYIDPWRPVARALITHGHSDHARAGHGRYLATHSAAPVLRHRLLLDYQARMEGRTSDAVIADLLAEVPESADGLPRTLQTTPPRS